MPSDVHPSSAAYDPRAVRQDVEHFGWHLRLVPGAAGATTGASTGYLHTVGLPQTWDHPEIVFFAPNANAAGMAAWLRRVVARVAAGERFTEGAAHPGLLGNRDCVVRGVHRRWLPHFLTAAVGHHGGADFDAVELLWADAEGRMPWRQDFSARSLAAQRLLFEPNPLLARLADHEIAALAAAEGEAVLRDAAEALSVHLEPAAARTVEEDWRWLAGDGTRLFRMTLLGDLLFTTDGGRLVWLDAAAARTRLVAADEDSWWQRLAIGAERWFRRRLLLHARHVGRTLPAGQVLSWSDSPMTGGELSLANLGFAPPQVHSYQSAQVAQTLRHLPPGAAPGRADSGALRPA
ncbi:MAG TPA: DUF4262 domain-containing protein [Thermoanaerobaculia bacterium]|nr:DUF4262 domain-containing protein [Thermoanaerobaculia bacterium]